MVLERLLSKPRAIVAAAGVILAGGAATMASGCPAGACFLEICSGANCHCSISSCGDGAGYDTKINHCRCLKGFWDVAGQCLAQDAANRYCGVGYAFSGPPQGGSGGGCVKLQCKAGDTLDEKTGFCIPKAQVAANSGVSVGQGQTIGCNAGEVLVVDSGQGACVPASESCAKDEIWNGTACQKGVACPNGQAFDVQLGRCVPYASSNGDELSVDVQQWTYTTYGPPNGAGAPSFCSTFSKKPLSFGIVAGSSAVVRVTVNLGFDGGQVAKGKASSQAVFDASGNPVPAPGAADVQAAVDSSFQALVAGGGKASAPTATTTVKCSIVHASKPIVVPETGGF